MLRHPGLSPWGPTGGQSSSTDPGRAGGKQQGATGPEGAETVWEDENTGSKKTKQKNTHTSAQTHATSDYFLQTCNMSCLGLKATVR